MSHTTENIIESLTEDIIKAFVGTDDEPGMLDNYFVESPEGSSGLVVWVCRRCPHVHIKVRNIDGSQEDLTLGELVEAAVAHEREKHDGAS